MTAQQHRPDWVQIVVMAGFGCLFWSALYWACSANLRQLSSGRVPLGEGSAELPRADAVTGCGELLVGPVTVALWGVEIRDCAGANAALQALVDPAAPLELRRGSCRLRAHETTPSWECRSYNHFEMPEREPLRDRALADARITAWVLELGRTQSFQGQLIEAGLARVSDACVAALEQAVADPLRRWPGACEELWLDQCRHDHPRDAPRYACMDRFRDPAGGAP